jgi:hypothetical protein
MGKIAVAVVLTLAGVALSLSSCTPSPEAGAFLRQQILSEPPGPTGTRTQTLEYVFARPVARARRADDGGNVTELTLDRSYSFAGLGRAMLPVYRARVVLPEGYELTSIEAVPESPVDFRAERFILSQRGAPTVPLVDISGQTIQFTVPIAWDGNQVMIPDESADKPFPKAAAGPVAVHHRRGARIAYVNLCPFLYVPKTQTITHFAALTVHLTLRADDDEPIVAYRPDPSRPIATEVDNPETLASYRAAQRGAPAASGVCEPGEAIDYVIVTSKAIADAPAPNALSSLIAHKADTGLKARAVTVEDVYDAYAGRDNAEKIRTFIRDAYNTWGVDYVLLAGDAHIIPARELYVAEAGRVHVPSDIYYQCLDGDFNADGDEHWGEPTDGVDGSDVDLLAEVYVGRVPVRNHDELANWVGKSVTAEKAMMNQTQWRVLMVGEFLGLPEPVTYAKAQLEEIRLGSNTGGDLTEGLSDDARVTSDCLYDADRVSPRFTAQEVVDKINADLYDVYVHGGHANEQQVMKFEGRHYRWLKNGKPFFLYSNSCYAGDFRQDCVARRLVTGSPNGASSAVLFSGPVWGTPSSTYGYAHRICRQFWDARFGEGIRQLGAMHADSHEDNVWYVTEAPIRVVLYGSNLFGDPAIPMMPSTIAAVGPSPPGP